MTPVSPDHEAAESKLVLLGDLLADLDRIGDVAGADLRSDRDLRHVTERVLTQLVDIAAGLNSTLARSANHRRPVGYRDSFEQIAESGVITDDLAKRILPSIGLRNILTHEYGNVDLDVVADAILTARRAYGEYVAQVRRYLLDRRQ